MVLLVHRGTLVPQLKPNLTTCHCHVILEESWRVAWCGGSIPWCSPGVQGFMTHSHMAFQCVSEMWPTIIKYTLGTLAASPGNMSWSCETRIKSFAFMVYPLCGQCTSCSLEFLWLMWPWDNLRRWLVWGTPQLTPKKIVYKPSCCCFFF